MGRKYYIDPNTGEKIYIRDKMPNLSQYRKAADQDLIDATKYAKPAGGIPKTDLSSEVQSMLESSGDGITKDDVVLTGVAGSEAGDVTPADVAAALKAGKTVILSRTLSMTGSPDDAVPVVFTNFAGTPDYGLVLASLVFPNALSNGTGDFVVQLIGSPDTGWVENVIPLSGGSGLPTVQKLAELTTTEAVATISIDLPKSVSYFILTLEGTGSAQASVRIQNQNNRDIAYGYNAMKTTATAIIAECTINSGANVIARMSSGPNFVANNANPTAFFSADYRDYVKATKLKVSMNSGTFNTGIRVRVWGY